MIDPLANVRIVLSHTTHPGNIGAAARAMKTMGLGGLYLVNPKCFPDAAADARASGAVDVLQRAKVCVSLDEALHGTTLVVACSARRRDLSLPVVNAREAARLLVERAGQQPVALVFGTEMSGLSNEEIYKCHVLAQIPCNPAYSSLNLGAAVQVLAYELRCAVPELAGVPLPTLAEAASHEETELFYQHLERVMISSGFLDPNKPKRLMPRMRRMFGRMRLEKEEANILRGILSALEKQK
ncbi:MAG: RNA methyltransferase [Pseudomonadota bacterium]